MTQHQCTKPCGSIDCAYGCITGRPWTGSEADSRVATSGFVKVVGAPPDPIRQAVDRWIDMERKAKAWDVLVEYSEGRCDDEVSEKLCELRRSLDQRASQA